jgi:YHS domain-containing protein
MLTILLLLAALAGDPKPAVNVSGNLALNGYDAVAYVTDGKPVRGLPHLSTSWNGAVWRFASAEHRDIFLKDPERYAPQFGGYCAWAVAHGYTANGDPEVWTIVGGKLYLNYSKRVQKRWEVDIPGYILKGQANWPDVLRK